MKGENFHSLRSIVRQVNIFSEALIKDIFCHYNDHIHQFNKLSENLKSTNEVW